MADYPSIDARAQLAGADRDDPGTRGDLTVNDKVIERIAYRAALDAAGVQRHSGGMDKLTGRRLPRVHVQNAGGRVRANVDVAVIWPWPLPAVAADVQNRVHHALTTWAGLDVDAVDVAVPTIVDAEDPLTERLLQ